MIGEAEIRARATALQLLPSHIERDYVLSHVLAAVAEIQAGLLFRGGTALARVYWPDFRLSEDLDFITPRHFVELEAPLEQAVAEPLRAPASACDWSTKAQAAACADPL